MRPEQRPELRMPVRRDRVRWRPRAGRRGRLAGAPARTDSRAPWPPSRGERVADRRAGASCSHTATAPGIAARRSRRRGTRESESPVAASATPSAFQNAVAASTFPAASADTAWKPIVTRWTEAGSAPPPWSTESSTASSEGRPVTPTVPPSRSRGVRTSCRSRRSPRRAGAARSAPRPTTSRPRSRAIARSWMSRIANCARPASSSFGASVDAEGSRTSRSTPASR